MHFCWLRVLGPNLGVTKRARSCIRGDSGDQGNFIRPTFVIKKRRIQIFYFIDNTMTPFFSLAFLALLSP